LFLDLPGGSAVFQKNGIIGEARIQLQAALQRNLALGFGVSGFGFGSWEFGFWIFPLLSACSRLVGVASCSIDFCFSGLFIRRPGIYRSKSRQTSSGLVSSRHRADPGCAEASAALWRAVKVGLVKASRFTR
jgi:hypothetical protein